MQWRIGPGILVNWDMAGRPRSAGSYVHHGAELAVSAEQIAAWKADPLIVFELVAEKGAGERPAYSLREPASIQRASLTMAERRPEVTAEQLRLGRKLLGWTLAELAEKSGLSPNVISHAHDLVRCNEQSFEKIRATLEEAGVEFLNHGQPGVRLRATR